MPGKASQWVPKPAPEDINVAQYVEKTMVLPFEHLRVDDQLQHGQIRRVNTGHRAELALEMRRNPPSKLLELVTWHSQGMLKRMRPIHSTVIILLLHCSQSE